MSRACLPHGATARQIAVGLLLPICTMFLSKAQAGFSGGGGWGGMPRPEVTVGSPRQVHK